MPTIRTTTIEERLNYLSKRNVRCHANGQTCQRTAKVVLTVVPLNVDTQAPIGEPVNRRVCTNHRKLYEGSNSYNVIEVQPCT